MSNFADILFLDNGMGQLPMVSDVFDSSQVQLGQQPMPFFPNQVMGQLNPFPDNTLPPLTCVPGAITTLAVPKFTSTRTRRSLESQSRLTVQAAIRQLVRSSGRRSSILAIRLSL